MTAFIALLIVGVILTLAGFFGRDDDGLLELVGLATIAFAVYVGYKAGVFPPGTFDFLK